MRTTFCVGLSAMLALSAPLPGFAAESAVYCASIEDAEERLACFDRLFGKEAPAAKAPEPPAEPELPAEPAPVAPAEPPATSVEAPAPAAEVPPAETPAAEAPSPQGRGGLMDWDEAVQIDTTVEAVRYRDQQKMVFRLANGQIWMQATPRYVRIREGDRVTIENATVGGYMMRSEGGVTTRVNRIH